MLPNAARAIVEDAKVRDYLLSSTHPIGRFKSVVFLALGYSQENWQALAADLLAFAKQEHAIAGKPTEHGQKYEVSGMCKDRTAELLASQRCGW